MTCPETCPMTCPTTCPETHPTIHASTLPGRCALIRLGCAAAFLGLAGCDVIPLVPLL